MDTNRLMTPALSVVQRAREAMKKSVGMGEPAVELPTDGVHAYVAEDGGTKVVIRMDTVIALIERIEQSIPKS